MVVLNRGSRLPVWADAETANALIARFAYAFVQPPGSPYPPILDLRALEGAFASAAPAARSLRAVPRPSRPHPGARASASTASSTCPTSRRSPTRPGPRSRASTTGSSTRCAAAAPDPHPCRAEPRVDRPCGSAAGGSHQHAQRPRLCGACRETPANVTPAHDGMVLEIASLILDDPRSSCCRSSW